MDFFLPLLQLIVAAGLLNVWLLRFNKGTAYRGKSAKSMPEEFAAYGLPRWFMWVVGTLKIGCAVAFVIGIWWTAVVLPAAVVLALLMVGAVAMHLKAGDPPLKFIPATLMLLMSLAIAGLTLMG